MNKKNPAILSRAVAIFGTACRLQSANHSSPTPPASADIMTQTANAALRRRSWRTATFAVAFTKLNCKTGAKDLSFVLLNY
jgi:hypothetical protein